MLTIKAEAKLSNVHGVGLFTLNPIPKGTIVWRFRHPDNRIPINCISGNDYHYGYINPKNPLFLVVCGDISRFWNFGIDNPNCGIADTLVDGEHDILSLRQLEAGEELLISVDSDADSTSKLYGNIRQHNQPVVR